MNILELNCLENIDCEASNIVGGSSLEVSVVDGKTKIRSNGFKVVKQEKKTKTGKSISIKATPLSSNKVASTTTILTSTSTSTMSDKEFDKLFEEEDW